MLVQKVKLSKTMKILLVVLGAAVVVGGGYAAYVKLFSSAAPATDLPINAAVAPRPSVATFDEQLFDDPRFYRLTKQPYAGFTNQYEGISVSDTEPLPPTEIKVENPARGRTLIISWRLPAFVNFETVRIYRSEDGILAKEIASLKVGQEAANTTQTYRDTALDNNKTYYYLVRTVNNDNQESKNDQSVKNIPTDIIPPEAPASVQVAAGSEATVEISWQNPPDEDLAVIHVYRSSQRGVLGSIIYDDGLGEERGDGSGRLFIVDQQIVPNVPYYYTVTSVDQDGNESSTDVLAAPFRATDYNPFEPITF